MTFEYPSSLVREVDTHGSDYIESITLRNTYNTNNLATPELNKNKGLIFIRAENMECRFTGCKTIDEEMKLCRDSFAKVDYYEDPEDPDAIERQKTFYDIDRVHDTRTIGGHQAEYYRIKQVRKDRRGRGDYQMRIMVLIKNGSVLYEINGSMTADYTADVDEDNTFLDAIVRSIRIGGVS